MFIGHFSEQIIADLSRKFGCLLAPGVREIVESISGILYASMASLYIFGNKKDVNNALIYYYFLMMMSHIGLESTSALFPLGGWNGTFALLCFCRSSLSSSPHPPSSYYNYSSFPP